MAWSSITNPSEIKDVLVTGQIELYCSCEGHHSYIRRSHLPARTFNLWKSQGRYEETTIDYSRELQAYYMRRYWKTQWHHRSTTQVSIFKVKRVCKWMIEILLRDDLSIISRNTHTPTSPKVRSLYEEEPTVRYGDSAHLASKAPCSDVHSDN